MINRQQEAHMAYISLIQSCPFSVVHCEVTYLVHLSHQATWQPTDINNHMVVCTDLATHSLPSQPPFLPVLPLSLVGYFKPQQAPKPQTTSDNVAAAASSGPQRPRSQALY